MKLSFSFSSYVNSQTSVDSIADKMQNLFAKQEPEGVYNKGLHKIPKIATYTIWWLGKIVKLLFRNKKIFLDIQYQVKYSREPRICYPCIFISLSYLKSLYAIHVCFNK